MLAELVREFSKRNNYEVLENYSTYTFFGELVTTLGIVVKPDRNVFDVLAELSGFIEEKEFDESILASLCDELEDTYVGNLGLLDMIISFPMIRDYQPLQS